MNLANGRVSTFETIIPKGWCNVRREGYTELLYNAFGRCAAPAGECDLSHRSRYLASSKKYSTDDHERDHTQSPNVDRTPFFKSLLAGWIDWVLASSSLAGEPFVLLTKLEFSWHCERWGFF